MASGPGGLGPAQLAVLQLLEGYQRPPTTAQLAKRLPFPRSAIANALAGLERRSLVRRTTDWRTRPIRWQRTPIAIPGIVSRPSAPINSGAPWAAAAQAFKREMRKAKRELKWRSAHPSPVACPR